MFLWICTVVAVVSTGRHTHTQWDGIWWWVYFWEERSRCVARASQQQKGEVWWLCKGKKKCKLAFSASTPCVFFCRSCESYSLTLTDIISFNSVTTIWITCLNENKGFMVKYSVLVHSWRSWFNDTNYTLYYRSSIRVWEMLEEGRWT